MDRFNIPRVAEALTIYAIERQNGMERHQPPGAPTWSEQRRFWTDAILQGMAKLEGLQPDPKLMERYDQRLKEARGCAAVEPLPLKEQTALIRELSRFISALEATGDDRRRQVAVVGDLLDDMFTHRSWGFRENGLSKTREQAESTLLRMTAQMPIRFTRVLLGGDAGPHWASGFVSGSVTDTEAVKKTDVYAKAVQTCPEITSWPALCTVYVGRGLDSAWGTADACEFDLEIMNSAGDRFLDQRGVRWVGGPYQMTVSAVPEMTAQEGQIPLLLGDRPLTPDDLEVCEHFATNSGGSLTFCLDVLADEAAVFGRQLSNEGEDSHIVVYSLYDETTGQVNDTLDIELRTPHDEKQFYCKLSPEVRESLKQKMDSFWFEKYGEHLLSPPSQSQGEPAPPQMGLTM